MSQLAAVKAMLERDMYERYSEILVGLKNLAPDNKKIIKTIGEYFHRYPEKRTITVDELRSMFFVLNPISGTATVNDVFDKMASLKIDNPELVRDIINQFVEMHFMSRVSIIATEVLNGVRPTARDDIKGLLAELDSTLASSRNEEDIWYNESLDDILYRRKEGTVAWGLPWLNQGLGPLRPGTLGHIFARPNVGKSSFAIFNSAFWACQWTLKEKKNKVEVPGRILYLQNEEHPENVRIRLLQCALGISEDQIKENTKLAQEQYEFKTGNRIIIKEEVNHIRKVEEYVSLAKPRVVFLDQGPKVEITGGREFSGPDRLQMLYNKYRELALKYQLIFITLGQAEGHVEGKKLLWQSNMDSSKTGIPGELDWALGIGKVDTPGLEEHRWFNVAKTKLNGTGGHYEVRFDNNIVRFKGVDG